MQRKFKSVFDDPKAVQEVDPDDLSFEDGGDVEEGVIDLRPEKLLPKRQQPHEGNDQKRGQNVVSSSKMQVFVGSVVSGTFLVDSGVYTWSALSNQTLPGGEVFPIHFGVVTWLFCQVVAFYLPGSVKVPRLFKKFFS